MGLGNFSMDYAKVLDYKDWWKYWHGHGLGTFFTWLKILVYISPVDQISFHFF